MNRTLKAFAILGLLLVSSSVNVLCQTPDRAIRVNPMGLFANGLAYVEYEQEFRPQAHYLLRLDIIRWNETESEIEGYTDVFSSSYNESGMGVGLGAGVKYYLTPVENKVSPFCGVGADIVFVNWEWSEYQYDMYGDLSYSDSGSGSTSTMSFHASFGANINLNEQISLQPGIVAGTLLLSQESDSGNEASGVGVFVAPTVSVGINF